MNDRQTHISLTKFLAAVAGTIGVAMLFANIVITGDDFGFFGLTFVAAAAVLRIRSYFCTMTARERDAFELGQETARVRQLH